MIYVGRNKSGQPTGHPFVLHAFASAFAKCWGHQVFPLVLTRHYEHHHPFFGGETMSHSLVSTPLVSSNEHVQATHAAETENHTEPERGIVEDPPTSDQGAPLDCDDGELQHHGHEPVTAEFLGDAAHDEFVTQGADQESDGHGYGGRDVGFGRKKDVAPEEVVDGYVPLPRELEPVAAVPPVRVEVSVGEAGDFGECAENVLPNDQKDQQEGDHEGEQHHAGGLRQHQRTVGERGTVAQTDRRLGQHGRDELLAHGDHEEDAAENGQRLLRQFEPANVRSPGVLEFVAQRRTEDVVDVVGQRQVLGVGDPAQGGGQLGGQVLPELGELFQGFLGALFAATVGVALVRLP